MNFPNDDDGDTLRRLAEAGLDLSLPRRIDFMVDAPDEAAGLELSKRVAAQGYAVELVFDDGGEDEEDVGDEDEDEDEALPWTVYASVTIVPSYEEVVARQKALTELAAPLGGLCEAWGTME